MAKIGLQNFAFGVLTEAANGTATYGAAQKPAKAISCNVSITNNDAKLYADDALAESDTSFQSGTVTIGLDDDNIEMLGLLLGHTVTSGHMVRKSTDNAPYVGLGRIITKMLNNTYKYKVEFLSKVKFSEPSEENSTKGESVEFGTYELEGTIATLADGTWSDTQTFDTLTAAKNWLAGKFTASLG